MQSKIRALDKQHKQQIATSIHHLPTAINTRHARIAHLIAINTDDLLAAFGLEQVQRGRALLRWLVRRPARRFARQVLACDDRVAAAGLQAGGAWMLEQFIRSVAVEGQAQLPTSGPLLIVANHPGLYDTLALFATIARPDLRVLAADRPFLRALPATSRYLIAIDDAPGARMNVVRAGARHLRNGGALLTFPAGQIEPDPAVLPGAVAALSAWSNSLSTFIRLVPDVTVLPVVVSGVLSPAALRHPLTHARRGEEQRQWLAATLQIVFPSLQRGTLRVAFGQPLRWSAAEASSAAARAAEVVAETRRVMERYVR